MMKQMIDVGVRMTWIVMGLGERLGSLGDALEARVSRVAVRHGIDISEVMYDIAHRGRQTPSKTISN